MTLGEYASLASIVAALLAVVSWLQWRLAKKQFLLTLMEHVHKRYSALYGCLDALPTQIQDYNALSEDEKRVIALYINLCSEQFFWWHWRGLIDNEVWQVWNLAIADKLRHPAIALAWKKMLSNDTYYKGFDKYVDNALRTAGKP